MASKFKSIMDQAKGRAVDTPEDEPAEALLGGEGGGLPCPASPLPCPGRGGSGQEARAAIWQAQRSRLRPGDGLYQQTAASGGEDGIA